MSPVTEKVSMKRHVAILIFDDVEVLDFTGPFEVFAVTDELRAHQECHVFTVSELRTTIRARNGLKIVPDFTLETCPSANVLVIPGGQGTRALLNRALLLEWVRKQARSAEVVMSVCTGALVLAKAGLLDGLRATTHHQCVDLLRELAPTANVTSTERFTDNGKICTSGGISAGIDLSLHVVARLLGQDAANTTARYMEYERRA
jgi:transcriptional regulator GlxA family with amidase domain